MRFRVSKEDIATGIREDCGYCPISNAISRRLPWLDQRPQVTGHSVTIFHGDHYWKTWTTASVLRFINSFDAGNDVPPGFRFTLALPDWLLNQAPG